MIAAAAVVAVVADAFRGRRKDTLDCNALLNVRMHCFMIRRNVSRKFAILAYFLRLNKNVTLAATLHKELIFT